MLGRKLPVFNLSPSKKVFRGMTLIELLISLSIIALMVGLAIPLFSHYQTRNTINTDAKALAQMFSYARALRNNPDSITRNTELGAGGVYIKLFTINAGNRKLRSVIIFTKTRSGSIGPLIDVVLDQLILSANENISINGKNLDGNDFDDNGLVISLSGATPTEVFTCDPATVVCSDALTITITSTKDSSVQRIVQVNNTVAGQLFSVSIK